MQTPTPPTPAPSRGLTNGLGAAGVGLAASGKSISSDEGVISATGLTNGTGISAATAGRGSSRRSLVTRWKLIAVLVAVAVVIPVFYFLALYNPAGLAVDGKYGDWDSVDTFGMYVPASGSGIAVDEWAVQNEGNSLYLYVDVEGDLMATTNVDSFHLFVDADHNARTGYSVSEIGADYMLVLDGWDEELKSASVMQYSLATDQLDWGGWVTYGSLAYSLDSGRFEARADLPAPLGASARYLLLSQTSSPDQDFSVSHPVPEKGGLLIAELEPGASISSNYGTVPAMADATFARLTLSCQGEGGSVSGIVPVVIGGSLVSSFQTTDLVPGEEKGYDIVVDTSAASATSLISVVLAETEIQSTFGDVRIVSSTVHAYVVSAPASIEVDGAFGDWLGRLGPDTDSLPVDNPNIDVTNTAYDGSSSFASFYVSVQGEMFKGVYAPSAKAAWADGGGGGPVIPSRKSGEDVLKVYIDSDMSNTTGLVMSREGKLIGAEYLIDIRGFDGEIVSKSLMSYDGVGWSATAEAVSAAKDSQRLEFNVTVTSIGGSAAITTIIETTDWKSRSDWAWAASVPDPWVVNGPGDTYQSDTGALWSYVGKPTLEPGDRIVDIAMTSDDSAVFLVTNTGRTYFWEFGVSAGWTLGENIPIDTATYSEAVSMTFYSKTGAWLLTKNGSYFYLMNAGSPPPGKEWTYQATVGVGVTDFRELNYEGGTMYAMRSGANTSLSYSNNGNTFISLTSPTGSTSNQTGFTYISGGPGSADDRVFVLCEDGSIRYSTNGGVAWTALGDLPTPTGANASKYVGIGIDSTGFMWIVTDTGYVFASTDSTTYASFNYTGQAPISNIVSIIPLPLVPSVPEFQLAVLVPIVGMTLLLLSRRIRRGRARYS